MLELLTSLAQGTYHIEADDFTIGLLDLAQLHQKVPESGFGDNGIVGEDTHAVEFGIWVRIGGQVSPDHLVFLKATCS